MRIILFKNIAKIDECRNLSKIPKESMVVETHRKEELKNVQTHRKTLQSSIKVEKY